MRRNRFRSARADISDVVLSRITVADILPAGPVTPVDVIGWLFIAAGTGVLIGSALAKNKF